MDDADFLHKARLRQKQPIAVEISKIYCEDYKFFACTDFYGHELSILVKMYTSGRKFYKIL